MQLLKQNRDYLIKYATDESERNVVLATANLKMAEMTKEAGEKLIEVVGKWYFYLGLSGKSNPDDIIMLCRFLKDTFPELTVNEIELAIDMKMKGHFTEVDFYGNLTPLYASQIINAYKEYRHEKLKSVFEKKERNTVYETPKMSMEENHKLLVDAIQHEWRRFNSTGIVDDLFSFIYDFAVRTGRISEDATKSEAAQAYAMKRIQADSVSEASTIGDIIKKSYTANREVAEMRYRRNFAVIELFKKINNIEDFISKITLEEA